ncbi:hypothetical protein [Bacillus sp. ISL-46]|uniref:hypothetical protein n=1 Tax=Bacillus sp. ISL-46 TaxID=2819129 RepID=UPI001BE62776|nr:hypothetical protein [Bacillus sp. ISL-46]MBT2722285.1 hypothetical protein [Bacillus sp. ISL-46]
MNLQIIKGSFNRGRMNIAEIKWLIDSYEQLQEENGAMAEKHAEKDMAIADFMSIVTQQRKEIELYQLQETILLGRLEKKDQEIKAMKQNSRLTRFYDMSEENLKLAQENARLKDLVKA